MSHTSSLPAQIEAAMYHEEKELSAEVTIYAEPDAIDWDGDWEEQAMEYAEDTFPDWRIDEIVEVT